MEEPTEEIALDDTPIEKPKKKLSPKQLENLKHGRDRLKKKVELTTEQKAQKKLEDRFDKLVSMFEKVQLPSAEIQEKIKSKKIPPQNEEIIETEMVVEKPRPVVRKPAVVVQPSKQLMFTFR